MGCRRAAARCAAWVAVCCLALCAMPAAAEPRSGKQPDVLPLTRVRLYETGIGYFERSGRISARTRLPIPAAQLDDALKSLVILDGAADSRLEAVRFDTKVTEQLGRALARLPTGTDEALDFEALARSLIGAKVALRAAGQTHSGQLLHVVNSEQSGLESCVPGSETAAATKPGEPGCTLRKQAAVLLLSEPGELMRFGLLEIESLRALHAADAE